ncbi:MAG: class I SAM-dependent methyltransferase [Bacteroidales bacterium]|nr:class I SAM-dependent methyltransferase [Bacteroidales bacterium]
MPKTKPFDDCLNEYEVWFIQNSAVYFSELKAIKDISGVPENAVEVGVGSGLFAEPLGIKTGIDPSETMREKAKERGIHVVDGVAENLPWKDNSIDYVLMVTTICFVDDVKKSLSEVYRVLKKSGSFILAFVDKNSPVGQLYQKNKGKSLFYKDAAFFGTEELYEYLKEAGFSIKETQQTVFGMLNEVVKVQEPREGYGEGSFVVINAVK